MKNKAKDYPDIYIEKNVDILLNNQDAALEHVLDLIC